MALERVDFGGLLPGRGKAKVVEQKRQGEHAVTVRINKRRMASIAAAADVVRHIPAEGEAFHGLMTGYYDLMHLLIALLARLASPCLHLRISTLCLSARNVQELATLLDTDAVRTASLLVSGFFRRQEKEIFAELLLEMNTRNAPIGAAPCHAKIITLHLEDGRKFTLEGSANLRTNRSIEQFTLIHHAGLHDHYAAWIDDMVGKHRITDMSQASTASPGDPGDEDDGAEETGEEASE